MHTVTQIGQATRTVENRCLELWLWSMSPENIQIKISTNRCTEYGWSRIRGPFIMRPRNTMAKQFAYWDEDASKISIKLYEDNQIGIAIANNRGYQSRAKHIDIRHHFVRQHVKLNNITLEYIESRRRLADFLTKALPTRKFQDLVGKSNIRNCMSRGSVEHRASSTLTANQMRQNSPGKSRT